MEARRKNMKIWIIEDPGGEVKVREKIFDDVSEN